MISIRNTCKDPHFNLALEEYAVKYLDPKEDYIILWQNEPSVIIGRNQNTIEEINAKYIKDFDINVVRRLSGGGAVYHDLGNLNFTFVVNNEKDSVSNFKKFTEPVISALEKFGIKAEFSGRNDITIDGKKFSGNAQYYHKNRLLHHGTILFNSDLSVVANALNVKMDKIASKGIKSVRSRVTNVYPYLENKITIEEFKATLLKFLTGDENYSEKELILKQEDLDIIQNLMDERYLKWEWNYGASPEFDIQKSMRFDGGKLELNLDVKDGVIKGIKIFGDFFGNRDVCELEAILRDINYKEEDIREALDFTEFSQFFSAITKDNFIECMFY
ncbi:lipoate--protein ligase [Clostridium omnivorum]|uniref:lipoate--protein ligase n=1 Tax=Clostridium omnivorum TaxID=1604902 RepID=A0ABQ5N7D1_9CLOT|nr:lipoate--protein ligase [Clostridium sp. E14]GLC31036.1 lipoate-protein ligase LplJ [Clostridium sp. E14]